MRYRFSGSAAAVAVGAALIVASASHSFAREVAIPLPAPKLDQPAAEAQGEQTAVFAGGCFWGVEAVFRHVKGVKSAVSGYAGGTPAAPSYELVSTGTTGHAETVSVRYDPSQVSYGQLLQVFMSVAHNPTELNRQGPDHGTQYRSAVFYTTPAQQKVASAYVAQLNDAHVFSAPIVTQLVPYKTFYPAEAYHQDYLAHHPDNPYVAYNDLPKLDELKRLFPERYRP
jgi:peptide-methionine (S)-S-oxide reductase